MVLSSNFTMSAGDATAPLQLTRTSWMLVTGTPYSVLMGSVCIPLQSPILERNRCSGVRGDSGWSRCALM